MELKRETLDVHMPEDANFRVQEHSINMLAECESLIKYQDEQTVYLVTTLPEEDNILDATEVGVVPVNGKHSIESAEVGFVAEIFKKKDIETLGYLLA